MCGDARLAGISIANCLDMPFKVQPGVLSKALSHMRQIELPIFLLQWDYLP